MGKAYECDKCKKLVKEAKNNIEISVKSESYGAIIILDVNFKFREKYYSKEETVELCKGCQIEVMEKALESLKGR